MTTYEINGMINSVFRCGLNESFRVVTQCRLVVVYQRSGATYPAHLQGPSSRRRMPVTLWVHSYVGNGVNSDWFSDSVAPKEKGNEVSSLLLNKDACGDTNLHS